MSAHVRDYECKLYMGWSLKCLPELPVASSSSSTRANRCGGGTGSSYLPLTHRIVRRGQCAWKRKDLEVPPWKPPTHAPDPHDLSPSLLPAFSMQASPPEWMWPRCARLLSGLWLCTITVMACLWRIGGRHLILFTQLIFMCISSLLYTECCTIHAASCFKKNP